MAMERLACLIVGRNLGDIVIQSGFFRRLAERRYAERYLVWTRPQMAFLFEDIPECEVVTSQFPVGTTKQFGIGEVFELWRAARQVYSRRPSVTLDLIGDVRERVFAWLAGSPRHLHIGWADDHPFSRLIRNPLGLGKPFLTVPANVPNIYSAYDLMLDQLTSDWDHGDEFRPGRSSDPLDRKAKLRIGLHPFASQRCKLWPMERWRELATELLATGVEVFAFGAPNEREQLTNIFHDLPVSVVTESISEFARAISKLDIMVGLDSFAVHMAERLGVNSVMINAGNHPKLWAPFNCQVLAHSGGCFAYPCYNVPRCEGTVGEFACVKAISVQQSLSIIFP